jgi:hypothetical protein
MSFFVDAATFAEYIQPQTNRMFGSMQFPADHANVFVTRKAQKDAIVVFSPSTSRTLLATLRNPWNNSELRRTCPNDVRTPISMPLQELANSFSLPYPTFRIPVSQNLVIAHRPDRSGQTCGTGWIFQATKMAPKHGTFQPWLEFQDALNSSMRPCAPPLGALAQNLIHLVGREEPENIRRSQIGFCHERACRNLVS